MSQRKRTKKQFTDYNDYRDRPFGLKWGPAFALDELMKVVRRNQKEALKTVVELPIMTRVEMDHVLQKAFLKSLRISIQLTTRDEMGKLSDNITGSFLGYADEHYMYLEEYEIPWDSIRNISIIDK